ncbi:hypothetical protein TASIC1_0006017900 [Trichoderma asperellum]|uniref:Uncharacterized protein n=1 Tax=Trichoderma asperellum TaxID=101201 RepID=A0A6V8QUG1_TRIAP|nr:hypothetical protein TASIC1_0006017900 [Trichoderma asperellum]
MALVEQDPGDSVGCDIESIPCTGADSPSARDSVRPHRYVFQLLAIVSTANDTGTVRPSAAVQHQPVHPIGSRAEELRAGATTGSQRADKRVDETSER